MMDVTKLVLEVELDSTMVVIDKLTIGIERLKIVDRDWETILQFFYVKDTKLK